MYAGHLADACIRAATKSAAQGRIYNFGTDCRVTQRQYINSITQALGLKPVTNPLSESRAIKAAWLTEVIAHLVRKLAPAIISLYAVSILTSKGTFESTRAREELGWQPRVCFEEGLLPWFVRAAS